MTDWRAGVRARQRLTSAAADALADSGRRVVVTGAGGWLGLATLELLRFALGDAFAGRVHAFGASARMLALRDGTTIDQRPLAAIAGLRPEPTLVLHLAFLTKDRVDGMAAEDYAAANAALSRTVLDALDRIGATGVFVASSGAARSADDSDAAPDMRLYGQLKRRDELDFAGWAETSGNIAVVTRIFNVAGPYMNKHQAYAMAAFILDSLAGRAITVRAPHRVMRGYVAIRELMSLVVLLLLGDAPATHSFDTGGDPLELADVAGAVAAVLGGGVERAPVTSDRIDHYVGDRSVYDALLAHYGIVAVPLAEQIADTADGMAAESDIATG